MTRPSKMPVAADVIAIDSSDAEAAEYIVSIAEPLRNLAYRADLSVVAYLLGMVVEEARANMLPKRVANNG